MEDTIFGIEIDENPSEKKKNFEIKIEKKIDNMSSEMFHIFCSKFNDCSKYEDKLSTSPNLSNENFPPPSFFKNKKLLKYLFFKKLVA